VRAYGREANKKPSKGRVEIKKEKLESTSNGHNDRDCPGESKAQNVYPSKIKEITQNGERERDSIQTSTNYVNRLG
jgi:hypothetical protein